MIQTEIISSTISLITFSFALFITAIGSYNDLRTHEVPDYLSYGGLFLGFFIHLVLSVLLSDVTIIFDAIFGFFVSVIIALFMFYTGQWGGGDSKLLIALGTIMGLPFSNFSFTISSFFIQFLINLIFIGAAYGSIYVLFLIIKNKKNFKFALKKHMQEKKIKYTRIGILFFSFVIFLLSFAFSEEQILLISISILLYLGFYLLIATKCVEETCMLKSINPAKLTEGDWIAEDIFIGKKYICGPKDLGIQKKQIELLLNLQKQKKISKILIKEGIPFVPSFFLSLLFTYFFGNVLIYFISI